MIEAFLTAFGAGVAGGALVSFLFTWNLRRNLYHMNVDVADLQERHLRSVRKAAANERWKVDDELDEKIVGALSSTSQPKGWKKWPSSDRSENS